MERKFKELTNTELEKKLKEIRITLNLLEDEQTLRKIEDKENAWANLVDEINEFCKSYGSITVSGYDTGWGSASLDIGFENIDTSTVGLIEIK